MKLYIRFAVTVCAVISFFSQLSRAAEAVANVDAPFALTEVRLLDGPFKSAQALDEKYIISLDCDRLLHDFRINAGLPSTAMPLGGWEAPTIELRGHFVGHYLSACSLMYQSTGETEFKRRVDYLVTELGKCQQALGGQYLSAFPATFFDRLESGGRVWAPYYTIHKIMAGLLDAYTLTGNEQALQIDKGMSAYFKQRMEKLDDAHLKIVLKTEFGGMMEVTANLYAITHNPADLALSQKFDDHAVFDPLAAQQDKLNGLHANTNIPKMTGAARLYELTGDERYKTIAGYFWDEVTSRRSFVTGGNSFREMFRAPGVEAGLLSPRTSETCNTYNMLKLTRHLFEWQPDAKYADYYERALFNHILGSIDPDSGMMLYFLSLAPGHFKVYNTPTDSFWCCTGTGVENHAKYGDSIYFHNDSDLWVNLYIASELTWKDKGLTLTQQTKFPEESTSHFTIHTTAPAPLAIHLRIPYWATSGYTLAINGQPQAQLYTAKPESYATIDRPWKDGDTIDISLPMTLHLYHAADLKNNVALMYGPIVLAAELGRQSYPPSDEAKDQNDLENVPMPPAPALVTDNQDIASWLQPINAAQPLHFKTNGIAKPGDVMLAPMYQIHHERYTVYFKLYGTADWAAHEQAIRTADEKARAEAALVVDEAGFGQDQPERDHTMQMNQSHTGQFLDRTYRDAAIGGWFSTQLKVLPDMPMRLRCTYWGSDDNRQFDILIDGTKLATQVLKADHPGEFFTVDYAIPNALTAGKSSVTVRFQSAARKLAGAVFGCAVVNAGPTTALAN